jgi:membrane protein DedA with SNARE-associated domain
MIRKILFSLVFIFSVLSIKAAPVAEPAVTSTDTLSFIQHIESWYKDNTNYFSITALMAAESSILPVPSEMVIPPAVYIAMEPGSDLSIFLIIIFGTFGALIGASFNYLMSMWLGRFVVYKFADSKIGKLFMLSSHKIQKAESFFNKHGKTSTFVGRLIPVVRHLISIPAGLSKMNYPKFLLYTFLGAGLWNIILAALGYTAGSNRDLINKYSHELSFVFLGIGVVLVVWLVLKSVRKKK